jgi:hypothetical protein
MLLTKWNGKAHAIYRPFTINMTKCRNREIPNNATIWEGEIKEITCQSCIMHIYNPRPNKLVKRRR